MGNFDKVKSIINSIDNELQIEAGENLIENFYKCGGEALDYFILKAYLNHKRLQLGVKVE